MDSGGGGGNDTEQTGSNNTGWWDSFNSIDSLRDTVGGWIGSAISTLVSPLSAIGSAIGSGFDFLFDKLGGWFGSLWDWLGSIASSIGGGFSGLFEKLATWFGSLWDWLGDIFRSIGGGFSGLFEKLATWFGSLWTWLGDIFSGIGEIVSYINPLSDKFFLVVAFVPEDDFFSSYSSKWRSMIETKFSFIFQLRDTMKALTTSIQSNTTGWEGVKINLSNYGLGSFHIISPEAIAEYSPKLKFWVGGLMYFLTGMWLFRKMSTLVGAGR